MFVWLFAIIAVAGFGSRYPRTRRGFLIATVFRIAAFVALAWFVTQTTDWVIAAPIVMFGLVALIWGIRMTGAWPDCVTAFQAADMGLPDKRCWPMVVTTGVGFILAAVASALSSWLFLSGFQKAVDEAGVGFGFSTQPYLVSALAVSIFVLAAGILTLVFGARRNPWYPAQAAYVRAAWTTRSDRLKAMEAVVRLTPGDVGRASTSGA